MFIEFVQEQMLLFVALIVIILMLIYTYVGDRIAGYKSVQTDEAIRLYNDDAFMLDVRTAGEFKEGAIGNATNISVTELPSKIDSLKADKSQPVLVYCLTGARSSRAASMLVKKGFTQVYNLAGGINAWKSAGLPVGSVKSKKNRKK
ncbi:MAG: rhodanese-like domain-containing protein [Thiomicrorhabdus chilensis]|uniref:rhodanese-like domain-containing protein n=1 Tax=Thiomicrorhabdus chilensis TaxID=63656 RepID=UPI000412600E|nr:rhodanese-like domain-containing protein [Thiomicrorhabdus chilensis]MDX1347999.1 rhodanese-like domain-containing protein [Thiomicrorhabdus chilensis]